MVPPMVIAVRILEQATTIAPEEHRRNMSVSNVG